MQGYNPSVNDRSGEILAAAQMQAAELQMQSQMQLASNISDAISTVAGIYAQGKAQDAQGKAFKDFMGVAGKGLNLSNEELQMFKDLDNRDAYHMSQAASSMLPSWFNATLYAQKAQNQTALPYHQAAARIQSQQPASNQVVPMSSPSSSAPVASGDASANPYIRNPNVKVSPVLGR